MKIVQSPFRDAQRQALKVNTHKHTLNIHYNTGWLSDTQRHTYTHRTTSKPDRLIYVACKDAKQTEGFNRTASDHTVITHMRVHTHTDTHTQTAASCDAALWPSSGIMTSNWKRPQMASAAWAYVSFTTFTNNHTNTRTQTHAHTHTRTHGTSQTPAPYLTYLY